MIVVWAALEGIAARMAAEKATEGDLKGLEKLFDRVRGEPLCDQVNEYSEANIGFHRAIIGLGGCTLIEGMTQNLFIHIRAIRTVSLRADDRAARTIKDHEAIVAALKARDGDLAERHAREHALGLAAHVEKHGVFSD